MTTENSTPARLSEGAKKVSVGNALTALVWIEVRTQLTGSTRQALREVFPSVAVQAFTATTEQYWQDWLSDDSLDALAGLVVVDAAGLPVAWVANNDRRTLRYRRTFRTSQ